MDEHSGSATVLLTAALVWVTWRYVQLTAQLVAVQQRQLEGALERERLADLQVRTALSEVARRLKASLALMPREYDRAEDMRKVTMWSDDDLQSLERFSAVLGVDATRNAAAAITGLRFLGARVIAVQRTSRGAGYDWNREFPKSRWPEYLAHLNQTEEALDPLRVASPQAIATGQG